MKGRLKLQLTVPLNQVVLTEDARRFADQMGIRLFETSAKVGFFLIVSDVGIKRMTIAKPSK